MMFLPLLFVSLHIIIMSTFIPVPDQSEFSVLNLPLGVFSVGTTKSPRCATRVGDTVIDLSLLEEAGLFRNIKDLKGNTFSQSTLNKFLEHEKPVWQAFRARLSEIIKGNDPVLQKNQALQKAAFYPHDQVDMELPITIGDYTDFYSSREHATNVGIMFRGKDNALQPNWLRLPVGYHGRSSTISITGHTLKRPYGQLQKDPNDPTQGSVYGPCKLLDFELEVAAVVGGQPNYGHALTIQEAKDRIYGFMLMNDWSARDIQKWEYVPLGPFTSKNFATTVSAWIVSTDALVSAPTSAGKQDNPEPLDYLKDPAYSSYDIDLFVAIQSERQSEPHYVCRSNFKNMYWNAAQQLCHHSVTGCVMKAGDLLGSGTISGSTDDSFGSMLELSWKGTREVEVGDETRKFLNDGDTVHMRGICYNDGSLVGFGECRATILPADLQVSKSESVNERYRDFKLYTYWRSSSTWRVRIALAAKDITYECCYIDLLEGAHEKEDFSSMNALNQVPVLEFVDEDTDSKVTVTQSMAIIIFLETAFPDKPSLIPSDPWTKARAFQLAEIINSGTQPLQNIFWLKSIKESCPDFEPEQKAKQAIQKGLAAYESLISKSSRAGPYSLGTFCPSLPDLFLVPQVLNAARFDVDVQEAFPNVWAAHQECLKHEWFASTHPESQADRAN